MRERQSIGELSAASSSSAAAAADVPCIGNGSSGARVEAIYAHASDQPDRYGEVVPLIRQWAANMAQEVQNSAAETGGYRTIRFLTAACQLVVDDVALSPSGVADLDSMASELSNAGYNRAGRDYVVWVDGNVYCGIAYVGGHFARTDNGCWNYAELHELTHNLGAVSLDAPNSSGGWHCTDEYDVMCYSDYPNYPTMRYVCPDYAHEQLLDCGNDDYFSTAPAAGGFLEQNPQDNSANSRFLGDLDGQPPTYLPTPPAGYHGPHYLLRLYNADDRLCAYTIRARDSARLRLFCVDYNGQEQFDITGALARAAGGASTARLRLVGYERAGGYTYGYQLSRNGQMILDQSDGQVGVVGASNTPLDGTDATTGWATFATRSKRLPLRPPDTVITSGPSGSVATHRPTFAFSSDTPAAGFQCRVDAQAWTDCSSPWRLAWLTLAPHQFQVRATFGEFRDPSPATRNFRVSG